MGNFILTGTYTDEHVAETGVDKEFRIERPYLGNWDSYNSDTISGFLRSNLQKLEEIVVDSRGADEDKLPTDITGVFREQRGALLIDVTNLDVSNVTNMTELFLYCNNPNLSIVGLETWDTSNVTIMAQTFGYLTINEIVGIEDWDVSSLSMTNRMFMRCTSKVNLGRWSATPNICTQMFFYYEGTSVDLSSMDFSAADGNSGYMFRGSDLTEVYAGSVSDMNILMNTSDKPDETTVYVKQNIKRFNYDILGNTEKVRPWAKYATELESIQCDGNQLIDTGMFNNNTGKMIAKAHFLGGSNISWGGRVAYANNAFTIFTEGSTIRYSVTNVNQYINNTHYEGTLPNVITLARTFYSVNDYKVNYNFPTTFTTSVRLCLLRSNNLGSNKYKLYFAQLYNLSDELVRDFIPVVLTSDIPASLSSQNKAHSSGEAGMWCKITNKFYGNGGSGVIIPNYKYLNLLDTGGDWLILGAVPRMSDSFTVRATDIHVGDKYARIRKIMPTEYFKKGKTFKLSFYTRSSEEFPQEMYGIGLRGIEGSSSVYGRVDFTASTEWQYIENTFTLGVDFNSGSYLQLYGTPANNVYGNGQWTEYRDVKLEKLN